MNPIPKVVTPPPCRNPHAIVKLARSLGPRILKAEVEAALTILPPNPNAARITLTTHAVLSLLEWMHDSRWSVRLAANPALRTTTGTLMKRMAGWMAQGGQKPLVSTMSLVVRYLIAMADTGVDVTDRHTVALALREGIPQYWPRPGQKWRINVDAVDQARFLASYDRFVGRISFSKPRKLGPAAPKSLPTRMDSGYVAPTQWQLRRARRPLADTEMGEDAPPLDTARCGAHAALTVFAEQIALGAKQLDVALSLAKVFNQLPLSKDKPERCATVAVCGLVLFTGIPAEAALRISLHNKREKFPANYNAHRTCLTSYLAQGFFPKIDGRIPPQDAEIPLPDRVRDAIKLLASTGLDHIGGAYEGDALTCFRETALSLMGWAPDQRTALLRMEAGWLYAAHHLCSINPGVIQLLSGNAYGPYRAEMNYLTVSESYLWQCAYRIHDEIYRLLEMPIPSDRQPGKPGVQVGKLAPSLTDLAVSGGQILAQASDSSDIAACATWILQAHGRRPTLDQPHPAAYVADCDASPVFLLADKNLGGGRRLRIVPASAAGTAATSKSLRP